MPGGEKTQAELEAEIAELRQRLEEAEQRASDLFDTLGDSLFIVDPQTMLILDANKNGARRLGYESDELIGMSLDDLEEKMPDPFSHLNAWESTFSRTSFYECLHRRKDGSRVPVEVSSRLAKRNGRAVLLNTVRDISVRKQLEVEREQLISDLDAYAHTVAHDLKNPVSVVMGYTEVLYEDYDQFERDEVRKLLADINRTSVKMKTIIDELLLLASIRKQDLVQTEVLDMDAIVREAVARQEKHIRDSGAHIVLADAWPEAVGYGPWVEEVWANYLSNALKYGGDPPVIELGAVRQADGMLRYWVRDNGQGIAPEDQIRLFDPFSRLDETRADGHGLGLSIVQRIIMQMGGGVGVDSTPGEGSTFFFTLPGA